MDDPAVEIPHAIRLCAGAPTADEQVAGLLRYFTEDASFLHPACYVPSRADSRRRVIGIYLFYRSVVWTTRFQILAVAFDEKNGRLFVELLQTPKFRILTRLLWGWTFTLPMHINFRLRREGRDGKWYIYAQEDIVQPMSFLLAIPPFRPLARIFYYFCEFMGLLIGQVCLKFGVWRPEEHMQRLKKMG